MIDRAARDVLALALRRLACGRITNDEFDASLRSSEDIAVIAIADAAWTLYDDFREHYLKGRDALPPQAKRGVARCLLFLRSDLEYPWPARKLAARDIARFFANVFTLGIFSRVSPPRPNPDDASDMSVWPFFSRTQLRREIARVTDRLRKSGETLPVT
jgi:hypothetical protein